MQKKLNAFPWYGGKMKHLPDILPLFPKDSKHFVDVFGGAGSVIINTPAYHVMTYNDINGELVNFFKQLRDNWQELLHLLDLTPYSKREFEDAKKPGGSDIERARKFYVTAKQSFSGVSYNPHWSRSTKKTQIIRPRGWNNSVERLNEIAQIFKKIQIEESPAINVISDYDSDETFFYCDPPYVMDTRTGGRGYKHEMSNEEHEEFLRVLKNIKGKAMVSGYKNELYDGILDNWTRIDFEQRYAHSTAVGGKGRFKRQESVWMNYKP